MASRPIAACAWMHSATRLGKREGFASRLTTAMCNGQVASQVTLIVRSVDPSGRNLGILEADNKTNPVLIIHAEGSDRRGAPLFLMLHKNRGLTGVPDKLILSGNAWFQLYRKRVYYFWGILPSFIDEALRRKVRGPKWQFERFCDSIGRDLKAGWRFYFPLSFLWPSLVQIVPHYKFPFNSQ